MILTILFLVMMNTKHLLADFVYQPPVMWMNKGNLKHYGGYLHAGFHSLLTLPIILMFGAPLLLAVKLVIFEFIAHYVIDCTKMNVNARYQYKCDRHNEFWILLGLDQYLHQLTYLLIAIVVFM